MQGERVTRSITEEMHKAAVLVASLERDVADELLQQMEPCQADSLRQAMRQLPHVDAAEARLAIQDFLDLRAAVADPASPPSPLALERRGGSATRR